MSEPIPSGIRTPSRKNNVTQTTPSTTAVNRSPAPLHRIYAAITRRPWAIVLGLVAVGSLLRIPQLNNSLMEFHSFRQTQTAMVAREFLRHGINLFTSPLPVFGAHADVPMEMPLFQAVVASVAHAGLTVDMAGRLVSLVSFQCAVVLLYVLMVRYMGTSAAMTAVILGECTPFTMQWGAAHLIEFMAVALSLGMVVSIDAYFTSGKAVALILGTVSGIAAFLTKSTTAPLWCLFLVAPAILLIQLVGVRRSLARISAVAVAVLLGLTAAFLWTRHADAIKAKQPIVDQLTSSALGQWNFGTVHARLDPDQWAVIATRITNTITGPLIVVVVLAIIGATVTGRVRERWGLIGLGLVACAGPSVFFNLYYVHTYYLSAIALALIGIAAYAVVSVTRILSTDPLRRSVLALSGTVALLISMWLTAESAQIARGIEVSGSESALSVELAELTGADDLIVVIGCDWSPETLYYADREGLMLPEWAERSRFWAQNDVSEYRYLGTCDPSLDPSKYLPSGTRLTRVSPTLYAIQRSSQ